MSRSLVIIFLIISVIILGVATTAFAAEPTTVGFPLLSSQAGQRVEIEAQIDCPESGCSAFDIAVQFDPQVLQIESVVLGPFLGTQAFTVENVVDNVAGTIRVAATALGDPPQDADNVLLLVEALALTSGTSQLVITEIDIGDMAGNPLDVSTIDGGVVVLGEAPAQAAMTEVIEAEDEAPQFCEYRVGVGDTLFGIALANDTTVDVIIEINEIEDRSVIRMGDILLIPSTECNLGLRAGGSADSDIIDVHDCTNLGGNLFQWYSVRRTYDTDGNPISEARVAGPFTGEWVPGCPGVPQQNSSGGNGGNGGSSNPSGGGNSGGNSGGGGSGGGDDDDGGIVCLPIVGCI